MEPGPLDSWLHVFQTSLLHCPLWALDMISALWRHWIQKQFGQCGFLYIFPRTPSVCEGCWPQLEGNSSHCGESWKWIESVRCSVMSDSLQLHGLWPARLLCPWNSPVKNTGVGSHSFSGDLPDPGIKPASAVSESPGKPALLLHKWINGASCCSLSNHPRKSSRGLNPEFTIIISCCHQGC